MRSDTEALAGYEGGTSSDCTTRQHRQAFIHCCHQKQRDVSADRLSASLATHAALMAVRFRCRVKRKAHFLAALAASAALAALLSLLVLLALLALLALVVFSSFRPAPMSASASPPSSVCKQ